MTSGIKFYFTWSSLVSALLVFVAWIFGAWALYYSVTDFFNQWHWLLLAVVYGLVPIDQYVHNVIIHGTIKSNPKRLVSRLLLFIAVTQMGLGRVKTFLVLHKLHHARSDCPGKDPLYFNKLRHNLIIQTLTPLAYFFNPKFNTSDFQNFYDSEYQKHQEFMDDPWVTFCNNYYIPITIAYWSMLYLFFPVFLLNVVFVGRVLLSLANIAMIHVKLPGSYQHCNRDHSYNHLFFHYLFLGTISSTLHNNHHHCDIRKGHSVRWYEFDTGYFIVKYLLKPLIT
jgi:fatty-acid desaturase